MNSAFDKIAAGLNDAIAYAEGDMSRGEVAEPVAESIDVRAIRKKANLTQALFAATYRLPIGTVRDWEQHRARPDTGSRVYLQLIAADPLAVASLVGRTVA